MNAVVYCRVSSKEQIEGTSLQSQEAACVHYANSKALTIVRTFIEQGESAKFADRPKLIELLDFVREHKGEIQFLLVWKVDRFARNVTDHYSVKATLLKSGVQIVSVTEPIEANPTGQLMETILAGFAQFDNDVRASRTVQGMRRKLQDGIYPWKPPIGYKTINPRKMKKHLPDQPDRPLFDLLQRAWEEFATGAYTKGQIKHSLDRAGVRGQNGKPLNDQRVDDFFRNPYYAGILVDPWSGEQHVGRHEAMVSSEDFARVQVTLRKRNKSMPHSKSRKEFPLRGLARCANCKRRLTGAVSRGNTKSYAYYLCWSEECDYFGKSIPASRVHGEFSDWLSTIAPKHELLDAFGDLLDNSAEERAAISMERTRGIQDSLENLSRELDQLIDLRTKRMIADDEFQNARARIVERQHAVVATSVKAGVIEQLRLDLTRVFVMLKDLVGTWRSLPAYLHGKFEVLLLPVGFIVGSIRTAEIGPLFRIFDGLAHPNSTLVALDGDSLNALSANIKGFIEILQELEEYNKVKNSEFKVGMEKGDHSG